MNAVLMATHFAAFFAAVYACRHSQRLANGAWSLVLGVLGAPVFAFVVLILLDPSDHAGNGTTGAWYLIFSVVTLGGVPAVTHLSAAASGVVAFRLRRWLRERQASAA